MAALTGPRIITKMDGPEFVGPLNVKALAVIWHGGLVDQEAGGSVLMAATGGAVVIGVANLNAGYDDQVDEGGASVVGRTTGNKVVGGAADGDRKIIVERGTFLFDNKAGDLLTVADVGKIAYVEDNHTVRKTAAGTIAAGIVQRVTTEGVYVAVGIGQAYGHF